MPTPSARQPIEILLTSDRFAADPVGRELAEMLSSEDLSEKLAGSILYYDFPTYADYEAVTHTPTALLLSPKLGAVAVSTLTDLELASGNRGTLEDVESEISQFSSILIGRLLKSKLLRRSLSALKLNVTPLIYAPGVRADSPDMDVQFCNSQESLRILIAGLPESVLNTEEMAEARSVIEGAKAMVRASKRVVDDPGTQLAAVALSKVETAIANFDQKQRRAALSTVPGPQRIRGLAGSGKTIILAMKAAHLHAKYPDANILVTFYTKSLKETIRALITKFYRHYKEVDPDWERVHVLHGWGGTRSPGVYSSAARRMGVPALNFTDARRSARPGEDAFEAACRIILESGVKPYYDYSLVDEGQDFPSSFYRLIYSSTKGQRDRKSIVWAYDELQNILDVKIRSPDELFGAGDDGEPLVSLERSAIDLPRGAENDVVLSKCYRNQREVLVVAHALGFGIYREVVQMLESAEHWHDVGYQVVSGDLSTIGSPIVIERPAENSPLAVEVSNSYPIIKTNVAADLDSECAWVVAEVVALIRGGLHPHDIMVVTLDDRASRAYFSELSESLALQGIATHNLLGDPYADPPFFVEDKVTLSTIYRAKGNEAPAVLAVGIDGVAAWSRNGRNKIFTAFTRAKVWLRVSGVGTFAAAFIAEVDSALSKMPRLEFIMPDLDVVNFIQRDLTKKQAEVKRIREEYLAKLREQGLSEEEAIEFLDEDRRGSSRI